MKTLSYISALVAGSCVLVMPPLLPASAQWTFLPAVPPISLSLVRTASLQDGTPDRSALLGALPTSATAPSATAPFAPAAAPAPLGVALQPLPSRELLVTVKNVNSRERATFRIGASGQVRAEEAQAIEQFFRCRRTGKHRPLDPGVLALLADIAKRWPGRLIEVISGYRAPPFGAPHSRHFLGHAIDLRVRGVRTAKVRDYVWRTHQGVGVGHYTAGNFLHVDSRDEDTAWSARQEASRPDYRPRWAKRARRGRAVAASAPVLSASRDTL